MTLLIDNMREITFAGKQLLLHPSGVTFWPAHALLIVADLHVGKGSFLARHSLPLQAHDTQDTLQRLQRLQDAVKLFRPTHVTCLGDSFHDKHAFDRLTPAQQQKLAELPTSVPQWTWVLGNHDPKLPSGLLGVRATHLALDGLEFRHEDGASGAPQLIGHYHPKLRISVRGQLISGKTWVASENTLILPSFGSYTGGLDSTHPAITTIAPNAKHYLIYREKIWKA